MIWMSIISDTVVPSSFAMILSLAVCLWRSNGCFVSCLPGDKVKCGHVVGMIAAGIMTSSHGKVAALAMALGTL
jgi:hypothetical protein